MDTNTENQIGFFNNPAPAKERSAFPTVFLPSESQERLLSHCLRKFALKPENLLLFGPPGSGKTSFLLELSTRLQLNVLSLSGSLTLSQLKKEVNYWSTHQKGPKLIQIDEVHQLNRSCQEFLIQTIDQFKIVIFATSNMDPRYCLTPQMGSRFLIYPFPSYSTEHCLKVLQVSYPDASADSLRKMVKQAGGDLRKCLSSANFLDSSENEKEAPLPLLLSATASEDDKYQLISKYIKSMRSGDLETSMQVLGTMLSGGIDPLYIARRAVIFASEDIGPADDQALALALNCYQACKVIGPPECEYHLLHITNKLTSSPKSRELVELKSKFF